MASILILSGRGFSAVAGCAVIPANKRIDTKLPQLRWQRQNESVDAAIEKHEP
jgi:hypothetical protein